MVNNWQVPLGHETGFGKIICLPSDPYLHSIAVLLADQSDHPHVLDDPEEHVSGVQQDGHGQLRRRRRRGGEREVHICPVLLGEKSFLGVTFQGHLDVPRKKGTKLSKSD